MSYKVNLSNVTSTVNHDATAVSSWLTGLGNGLTIGQTVICPPLCTTLETFTFYMGQSNLTPPAIIRPFVFFWNPTTKRPVGIARFFGEPFTLPAVDPVTGPLFLPAMFCPRIKVKPGQRYVLGVTDALESPGRDGNICADEGDSYPDGDCVLLSLPGPMSRAQFSIQAHLNAWTVRPDARKDLAASVTWSFD